MALGCLSISSQTVIEVGYSKNVHLIFSSDVVYDDCASQDVLLSHLGNIEKLGAATEFSQETSLSVITEDNLFFSFIIRYSDNPSKLTYTIPDSLGIKMPYFNKKQPSNLNTSSGGEVPLDKINYLCNKVSLMDGIFTETGGSFKGITIELSGIWISSEMLFFKLLLSNDSNIPYDIGASSFYIQDKQKLRKSSSTPQQISPLHICSNPGTIEPNTKNNVFIMVFEKFTLGPDKKLIFEMTENNGGRMVKFDVLKDLIIQAPMIN
jgi:conjugative transposon TraN protein